MKTFVMLILLFQIDPYGNQFITTHYEDPIIQYDTLEECESTAEIKRDSMLDTATQLPELGILDINIGCVEPTSPEMFSRDTIQHQK
jgi:hypothetical protein